MGNFSSSKRSSDTGSQQESNRTCSPLGLLSQAEVAAVKSVMADGASQNNNNNNSNNTVATFFVNSGAFNRALGALSPGDLTELDTALRQWISGADSLDKVKAEWVAHAEVVLRGTRRANRDNLHKCMDHDAICSARVLWLLWQFAESNACSQDEQTTSPILPDEQREVVEALDNSATCVPSSPTNDDTRPKAHDDDAQQVVSEPPPRPPPQSPPQSPPPESPPPPDDTRQAVSSSLSTSSTSPVEAASTSAGEASTSADGSMEVARAGYHQVLCLLRGLIVHATKYQEQHSYGTAKYSSSSSSSSSSATRTAQQSESDSNNSSKNTPSSAALQALSPDAFSSWIDAQVPGLFTPARDFVLACIKRRGGLVSSLGSPSFQLPRLGGTCPSEIVSPVDLFALSCADPALRTTWSPLYLSGRDGRSFTSLVGSVLAYPAATLLLIRDRDNRTFGALAKAPWQESHEFFGGKTGGNGSFLFALRPTFHVFRARGSAAPEAQHFQYLNARNKHALKGIGLGGSEGRPRLFLNEDMDACRASDFGMTFEMGPLRSNVATAMPASLEQGVVSLVESTQETESLLLEEFEPVSVEVWGLGGEECEREQQRAKDEHHRLIMARRKVDTKQFGNSTFDREFLLGKTFAQVNSKEDR